ncbi:MAG: hypothetical protein QXR73_02345 [Candidatus Micrarchaeaceae archaeon]
MENKIKILGSYIGPNGNPLDIIGLQHNNHIDIKERNPLTGEENMMSHRLSVNEYESILDKFPDWKNRLRR